MFLFDVDLNKGIIWNPLTFISPFKMQSQSRHWNLVFYETKPDNFILLSVRGIDWIPSRLWFGSVLIFHVFLNYVSPYSFFYFAVCVRVAMTAPTCVRSSTWPKEATATKRMPLTNGTSRSIHRFLFISPFFFPFQNRFHTGYFYS